jgi:general secretion pathway protein L
MAAPGESITLARVTVPGRNRATRLKAIPYALEESLADDVEDLHFAVGNGLTGTTVAVAAIRHNTLTAWLEHCHVAGLNLNAVVPEPLLLPRLEAAWSVLVEKDRAVVRTGHWTGFTTEPGNLVLLLELALAETDAKPTNGLRVWGTPAPELAGLELKILQQPGPTDPLTVFAANRDATPNLNLLQGPYSRNAELGKWLRPWRAAAILAGLWLGSQAGLQITEYRHLQREQAALDLAMEELFKTTVPTARRIVNPRAQLENRLRELRQEANGGSAAFLDLLYRGGELLIGFEGITVRGVRYKDNQLHLNLTGGSLEAVDRLKQNLTKQHEFNAQVRTTKREGKARSKALSLSRGSSHDALVARPADPRTPGYRRWRRPDPGNVVLCTGLAPIQRKARTFAHQRYVPTCGSRLDAPDRRRDPAPRNRFIPPDHAGRP